MILIFLKPADIPPCCLLSSFFLFIQQTERHGLSPTSDTPASNAFLLLLLLLLYPTSLH